MKARLLDQNAIAGIGNLLADQALWLAKINPRRPVRDLTRTDVNRLYRAVLASVESAVGAGGVHTLSVIPSREPGGLCPRDGVAHGHRPGRRPHHLVVPPRTNLIPPQPAPTDDTHPRVDASPRARSASRRTSA